MANLSIFSSLDKSYFWVVCTLPVAWMSENVTLSWSVLLLAALHMELGSFHRVMMVREWQISDLLPCDGKHACTKFIVPHLISHVFLMMFIKVDMCSWPRQSVCHSPDGCSPGGILARSPPLQTQTSAPSHTHALSGPLMCSPWAPSSPVAEVEQQGAKEWWRLEERNADQRETHLQVRSVMLWSGIKLLTSLAHCLTHLVSHPLTSSLNQSLIYLLTDPLLTLCGATQTSKSIK